MFIIFSRVVCEVRSIVSCDQRLVSWLCWVSIPALYKQSLGQDRLGGGGAWPSLAWPDSPPVLTSQSTLARPTVSPLSLAKLGNTGGVVQ